MQPAVFLDRDNTLIANDGDLGRPDEVRLIDGVAEGLKALREAGYRLIVVTNQGGVARGHFTEDDIDAVHQRIATLVDESSRSRDLISRFYYCPYHPEAPVEEYRRDHPWRKPHPGMLIQAARDLDLDLAASWMIGDQPRDVAAGRSAGCRTILVNTGTEAAETSKPTVVVQTFPEAVKRVLSTGPVRSRPTVAEANGALAPSPTAAPGGPDDRPDAIRADLDALRRAVLELAEELRTDQLRRREFSGFRLAAGMCQLLAILVALLGLLQLGSSDLFFKWMIGAALVQMLTIALLLLDLKG